MKRASEDQLQSPRLKTVYSSMYMPYLVIIFLVTIVICVAIYVESYRAVNENVLTAVQNNVEQIHQRLQQQADEMLQVAKVISINPEFQAMVLSVDEAKVNNAKDIRTYYRLLNSLEALRKVHSTYLVRIYVNDNVIFANETQLFFPLSEIAQSPWHTLAQSTPGQFHWVLHELEEEEPPTLAVIQSSSWKDAMDLRSVILIGYKNQYLRTALTNPFMDSGGHTFLITPEGKLLSESGNPSPFASPLHPEAVDALYDGAGTLSFGDTRYLVATKPLDVAGLLIVSMVPETNIYYALSDSVLFSVILLSVLLLVLIGFAVRFAGRYVARIRTLASHIETIEEGGFSRQIAISGNSELSFIERKFNEMSLRLKHMIEENRESARRKREAEVRALQAQMNPHFLHNTLDVINWMAIDAKQYDLAEIIATLGTFYRQVLSGGESIITVREELQLTENYVRIQKLRRREDLEITFEVDEDCLDYLCVKMTMQPLIENAIKHGGSAEKHTRILITLARLPSGYLQMGVADNGVGLVEASEKSGVQRNYRSGYGLKNIEQRLMLHFGSDIMMTLDTGLEGKGTCVTLKWRAVLQMDDLAGSQPPDFP